MGPQCQKLQKLVLAGCDCITDAGIEALLAERDADGTPVKLPLRELDLAGAFHVGDVAIDKLARQCPDLRAIKLDGSNTHCSSFASSHTSCS